MDYVEQALWGEASLSWSLEVEFLDVREPNWVYVVLGLLVPVLSSVVQGVGGTG